MAAARGLNSMVAHLLERNAIQQWKYGPITSTLYPLEGVDVPHDFHWGTPVGDEKKKNDKELAKKDLRLKHQMDRGSDDVYDLMPGDSVICHLARGNDLQLFDHHLIRDILDNKWRNFGRPRFYRLMGSVLLFMALFTVAEVGLAEYKYWQNPSLLNTHPVGCFAQMACEGLAVLIYWAVKLRTEIIEAYQSKGWTGYIRDAMGVALIDNVITIALNMCIVGVAVARVGGHLEAGTDRVAAWREWEGSLTSIMSLVGWSPS